VNVFAQERGHKVCQNIGVGKCDNPKCSLNCHAWWAYKKRRCLERYCSTLPTSYIKLCGSLKMWDGATIEDHKKARERLQTRLRKWERQTGEVFRVLLCSHPTGVNRLHYDAFAYTSVSLSNARKVLKAAWTGQPRSVHKVEEIVNVNGWLKYFLKDVKRQEHDYVFLLERGKLLKQLYGCPQFGFSKAVQKESWETLCHEDHGDRDRKTYYEMLENTPFKWECRKALVEMVTFIVENKPSVYELKSRFRGDVRYVHVDLLKECAGLRQRAGRYEFDGVLGVPLPPSNPTERQLWEQGTGQSSKDLIETFAQAASKAVMRRANKRQRDPDYRGLGYYSQSGGTMEHLEKKRELIVDNVPALINNKLSLSPSTYTEPVYLPLILRRPVARE
jgi:hypothetical protein